MSFPLNPQQLAAVRHVAGPLLVLAGAGSGKTRVITAKIAHLIATGMPAKHIAAITFTNRAAKEMKTRAEKLLAGGARSDAEGLTVCTFHSLGHRIARSEARHLGLKPSFSIFDSGDVEQLIAGIVKSSDRGEARKAQWQISKWKNALLGPADALRAAETEQEAQWAKVYEAYALSLSAYQAVDFDDLLLLPVRLFETAPERLAAWRDRIRYLLIDEYQDTNAAQYKLVQLLEGVGAESRGAFTAVGDDDQAIYGWRGASADNLARLTTDYPQLAVIKLEQNYRSSVRILRSANRVIANNRKLFDKKLWSEHGLGDALNVIAAADDEQEAEIVVRKILAHRFEKRTQLADYAILYRGNHQARPFEQALRAQNVAYTVSGGTSLFERSEIKDLLAYFRLLVNEDDDPAFIRAVTTPKRGIGAASLEKLGGIATSRHVSLFGGVYTPGLSGALPERQADTLREFCDAINKLKHRAEREPAGRLLEEMLEDIGYEAWLHDQHDAKQAQERCSTVRDFTGWLSRKAEAEGRTLLDLAQTLALVSMLDDDGKSADAVRLSTLHAAKGLEFPHVFLVGVEEGLLPHRESVENGQIDEERRLMYVGITRAQQTLTITHCRKRKRARDFQLCEPSRFIAELEQDDVRYAGQPHTDADPAAERAQGRDRIKALRAMLHQQ